MNRIDETVEFIEFDRKNNFIIEPEYRHNVIKDRIFDIIRTFKPETIVKAGLGSGKIIIDIAAEFDLYIVVVEPSITAINDFIEENSGKDSVQNIHFINGDLHDFPVDYYAADLLLCIDYLNIFDSGRCLDEFKRAIKFEKHLFFSGVILKDEDIEGLYDDLMRMIFPLHNDFYLLNDFNTFLELKSFTPIKNILLKFNNNLEDIINYFKKNYKDISAEDAFSFLNENSEEFSRIYGMDENFKISEYYLIGVFKREKVKEI